MGHYEWTISLMQLQVKLHLQHYVIIFLFLCSVPFYPKLKNIKLQYFPSLLLVLFFVDLIFAHVSFDARIRLLNLMELGILIFGFSVRIHLKREGIVLLLPLLAISISVGTVGLEYALRGWRNLFIANLNWLITAPFFFALFYRILDLSRKQKKLYLAIVIISLCFFLYDYFKHDNSRYNYVTAVVFNLQHVILCCLILGSLVFNEKQSIRLIDSPVFWVCSGRIIYAFIGLICDGLHPYLVEHYREIYKTNVLLEIQIYNDLILELCNFYAFYLCVKLPKTKVVSASQP